MNILLSAGPTIEALDEVRFLSNRSSGKMGVALAEAALALNFSLQVVHGPLSVPKAQGGNWSAVESALDMRKVLLEKQAWADVVIMAAAVCDYAPLKRHEGKLDKDAMISLELVKNPDICFDLCRQKKEGQLIVSFSLENNLEPARALEKARRKGSDFVVINALGSMNAEESIFSLWRMSLVPQKVFEGSFKKRAFAEKLLAELQKAFIES